MIYTVIIKLTTTELHEVEVSAESKDEARDFARDSFLSEEHTLIRGSQDTIDEEIEEVIEEDN